MFSHFNSGKILFGAQNDTYFKLFNELFSEFKQRENVINAFYNQLKYTANFHEPLKQKFFPEIFPPVEYQTFNI
jgi:hypothetical protein